MYSKLDLIVFALTVTIFIANITADPVMTRQKLLQQSRSDFRCSNVVLINNAYYAIDDHKNITGIPADISIHWKSGNVFFTLITEELKMALYVLRPSGEIEMIKVGGLGQSTAVDNLNDIVYVATDNGVYKYKEDTSSIELFTALGEDVMYIGVTSDGTVLYIATWPQNKVQMITNEGQKQETFPNIPNGHGLTVDTRNNIYFVATKTSYVLKAGERVPIKIKGLPSDRMTGIFVSRSDDVYAMDENSNLYIVNQDNASAKRLGSFNLQGVNTFGMDSSDDVLIGIKDTLLKFKVHESNPCPTIVQPKNGSSFKKRSSKSKNLNTMVTKRHVKKQKKSTTTTSKSTTTDYDDGSQEDYPINN